MLKILLIYKSTLSEVIYPLELSYYLFWHCMRNFNIFILNVTYVSCIQHTIGSRSFIQSNNICLLSGSFWPFTFNLIINMIELKPILSFLLFYLFYMLSVFFLFFYLKLDSIFLNTLLLYHV